MILLQATLQVSETVLRVPLDYSAVFAITLRHAGDSANSLAFKVGSTISSQYAFCLTLSFVLFIDGRDSIQRLLLIIR